MADAESPAPENRGRGNSGKVRGSTITAQDTPSANIPSGATEWAGVPLADLHPRIRYRRDAPAYLERQEILSEAAARDVPVAEVVAEYNARYQAAAVEAQRRKAAEAKAAEAEETSEATGKSKPRNADAKREEASALKEFRLRRSSRERPRPRLVPLVAGLIDAGTLFFIAGKPGHGKSHIVADLGCSVATGHAFARREVQRGPVVFLVGEGELSFSDRVHAWERLRNDGHTIPYDALMVLPGAEDLRDPDSPTARAMVMAVTEVNPSLVFIDTLNRYTAGADENASKEMGSFLKVAANIQEGPSNPAVGIVHHTNKSSDELRGSSAINGAADTVLLSKDDGPGRFKVEQVKQRNREDGILLGEFTLEATSWSEEDAEGEPVDVESVVAVWGDHDPETNHEPNARELQKVGVNLPGLNLGNAVLALIAAMGGDGMSQSQVTNYMVEHRTPKPERNKVDRAYNRLVDRKDRPVLVKVSGTVRHKLANGAKLDELALRAKAEIREQLERETGRPAGTE